MCLFDFDNTNVERNGIVSKRLIIFFYITITYNRLECPCQEGVKSFECRVLPDFSGGSFLILSPEQDPVAKVVSAKIKKLMA